jgi:hypothetical protein
VYTIRTDNSINKLRMQAGRQCVGPIEVHDISSVEEYVRSTSQVRLDTVPIRYGKMLGLERLHGIGKLAIKYGSDLGAVGLWVQKIVPGCWTTGGNGTVIA